MSSPLDPELINEIVRRAFPGSGSEHRPTATAQGTYVLPAPTAA